MADERTTSGEGFQEEDEWDRTLADINLNFSSDDLKPKEPTSERTYKYKGVPILFPYTAYKSQRQMMQKIIEGVTTGENCLLESPTGTGKTAALLCALLGWQRHCYNTNDNCKSIIDAAVAKMGGCTCGFTKSPDTKVIFKRENNFGKLYLFATTVVETPVTPRTPGVGGDSCTTSGSNSTTPATPRSPGESDSCTTSVSDSTTPANSPSSFKIPSPSRPRNSTPVKMEVQSPPPTTTNVSPVRSPRESSSCPVTPRKLDMLPSSTNFESPPKKLKVEQLDSQLMTQTLQEERRELDAVCAYCTRKYIFDNSRPPRIYYATRTHSQITQVVKQLKNSAYNKVKMTILGSREVTCINENVAVAVNSGHSGQSSQTTQAQSQDKNQKAEKVTAEDCCSTMVKNYYRREKIKANYEKYGGTWNESETDDPQNPSRNPKPILPEPVCPYYRPPHILEEDFKPFQNRGAFDLEDLKTEGMACTGCPYYGSRALQSDADIVFLSYNYLIFPSIREIANIRYINSVLVFDEAHNIEDICRNAFSFSIDVRILDENIRYLVDNLIWNIQVAGQNAKVSDIKMKTLESLSNILKHWSTWIKQKGLQLKTRPNNKEAEVHQSFQSEELLAALNEMQMTGNTVENCVAMVASINSDKDGDDEDYYLDGGGHTRPVRLASSVGGFFKSLDQSLSYLFKDEKEGIGGVQDFKGYLTRTHNPNPKPQPQQPQLPRRSRGGRGRVDADTPADEKKPEDDYFFRFQIICLNPAIGFRVLRNSAFSIIVASGTLTPLSSFASELATKFAVTLQADHVIPKDNVWTGVVSVGPRSTPLKLIKKVQDDPDIQDEIGDIIVQVCNTVPNGILVFLPSYPLMTKLKQRWAQFPRVGNTIMDQIGRTKMIFFEQSKNKAIFKRDMELYAEKVKGGYNFNGCILFAVFRGKVSEGIDFADEQARAVITVGIPYSNAGAVEVVSKKEYNDNRRKNKKPGGEDMLSGSEWYTIQAYRAMNQGFGRCVRHANDWGALILIDSRLGQRQNAPYISGWVKKDMKAYDQFGELKQKLLAFITERRKNGGKRQITIDYEEDEEEDYNALENTEIVPFPDSSAATQIVSWPMANGSRYYSNIGSAITQRINMSTLPREEDVTNVAESSPEYSFTDETQLILEERASPMQISQSTSTAPVSMNENSNCSSISLFERTLGEDGGDSSGNESDLEMSRMADIMQSSANEGDSSLNQSEIMDVSMPSERDFSESEVSQASSISYNSD